VVEASKQCGRNRLMELADPADWADYARAEAAPLRLLADPLGAAFPPTGGAACAAVAIGPEGGFTAEEVEMGRAAGWRCVRLGATLLRIETAGLAACAAVLVGPTGEDAA
jgi:16S rRNA (uracil1498-N3)-methyltransferase